MKKILLPVLVTLLFIGPGIAQNPLTPCCAVIAIGVSNNMAIARDNTTGRLFQFKADALEIKKLKKGDAISINEQTQQTAAINGISKTYTLSQPDPVSPCCSITGTQPDPADPCCNIISGKNTATGTLFSFSVIKSIAATLHIGQAISVIHFGPADFGPADFGPADFGPADFGPADYAIVESSIGALKGRTSAMYSYHLQKAPDGNTSSDMKVNKIPGNNGRVLINIPADVVCVGNIYTHNKNERLIGFSYSKDRVFFLKPGVYDLRVSSEIIQDQVTVQKGMDTRIHAGMLNVVTPVAWMLFDETKKIQITNAPGAKKIGLPVGNYQLRINGTFQPVIIKDGETLEL